LEKSCKIAAASPIGLQWLLLSPIDIALSSAFLALNILFLRTITEVAKANVLPLLLSRFCTYFSLQTRQFLLEAQKYFCTWAKSTLATPLLTLIIDVEIALLILTTRDIDSLN